MILILLFCVLYVSCDWTLMHAQGAVTPPMALMYSGVGFDTNGDLYIYGGQDSLFTAQNILYKLDHIAETFSQITPVSLVPAPLYSHAMCDDNNRYLYVFFGKTVTGIFMIVGYQYSIATNSWVTIPTPTITAPGGPPISPPYGLYGSSIVSDHANHLYLFGGIYANGEVSNGLWKYTISGLSWALVSNAPTPRGNHFMAIDYTNANLYIGGGIIDNSNTISNTFEIYNYAMFLWSTLPNIPNPINEAKAAWNTSTSIYIYGGFDPIGYLDFFYRYDIPTNTFIQIDDLFKSHRRTAHIFTYGNSKLYMGLGIGDDGTYAVNPLNDFYKTSPIILAGAELCGANNFTCNGLLVTDPTVCNSNGICAGQDQCVCSTGWTGQFCDIPLCPGCQHGTCSGVNTCVCDSGWTGPFCSLAICNGISSDHGYVCNSHGYCLAPNKCSCNNGWSGQYCETECGVIATCNPPCQNYGSCVANNICKCSDFFVGDRCQYSVCHRT
jgi:hypothetical protein